MNNLSNYHNDLNKIITLKGKSMDKITQLGKIIFSNYSFNKEILEEYKFEIELGKDIDLQFRIKIDQIRKCREIKKIRY